MANVQDRGVPALGGGRSFGGGGPVVPPARSAASPRPQWSGTPLPTKEKHYVEVLTLTNRQGEVVPLRVIWEDGRCFDIVDVIERKRIYAHSGRRLVTRYTVRIRDRSTFLYFEDPRWFVEAKVPPIIRGR